MPLKYGDVVVKVQRLRDGSISRVNAIVLASAVHVPTAVDRTPLKDAAGQVVAASEHIDLAYPDPGLVTEGQTLKTRNVESIFRLAYDVAPYESGNAIGWERPLSGDVLVKLLTSHASTLQTALATEKICEDLRAKVADLEAAAAQTTVAVQGTVGDTGAGAPSAEDLDRDAAEKAAAAVTIGAVKEDPPAEDKPSTTE